MIAREELDILIDSNYEALKPESPFLSDKDVLDELVNVANLLNGMEP
jgi:hypothetical protein